MRRFALTAPHGPELADFVGRWRVSRTITDHHARTPALFTGEALFTPDTGGLAYVETGELTLPGHAPLYAERRYHWRHSDTGFDIHFDDGRFFHSFTPDAPTASHWCDPDSYDVAYDFSAWPEWTSTWTVTGPRKAYDMVTTYRPIAPEPR